MKISNRQAVFLFLLFCLLISQLSAFAADKKTVPFIVITDIHFDPFISCGSKTPCPLILNLTHTVPQKWPLVLSQYDKGLAKTGQDTNWPLLVSTLRMAGLTASQNHAQFVLLLGDYLGHDYPSKFKRYAKDKSDAAYQAFTQKTLQFLTLMVAETFPGIDIYPLLGNNDSYHGDYYVKPQGRFFEETAKMWGVLIKDGKQRQAMQNLMHDGGYYVVDLQEKVKLIMLNTTLFSDEVKGQNVADAAEKEMQWFKAQLQRAKEAKQTVLIAMHIPMRIDLYATSRWRLFTMMSLWRPDYIEQFEEALEKNAANISGIFAGHLHSNWYQLLTFHDESKTPLVVTASISPIFGNDPTFRVYHYSADLAKLQDYRNIYLATTPTPSWRVEKACECLRDG